MVLDLVPTSNGVMTGMPMGQRVWQWLDLVWMTAVGVVEEWCVSRA
jgi:hypothetical protein